MARPEVNLPRLLRDALRSGHPWVYRNHVDPSVSYPDGTEVVVRCAGWRGIGLWDATGAIAIRIYSSHDRIDAALLHQRVLAAWNGRAMLRRQGVTAYRWLFGEGDGLPGLTVDLYGTVAVVQSYGAGPAHLMPLLIPALCAANPDLQAILGSKSRDEEPQTEQRRALLWGQMPEGELVVTEHAGLRFVVDPQVGQKTGLFLDHRENRHSLMYWVADKTVLNCFSYTGAFSLYALKGGARKVVSADIGRGLAEAADRNIALNGLPAERHQFVTTDCFDLLQKMTGDGRKYDIIILDPPSFARTRQQREAAILAYTRLNALAMKCLTPNGLLVTASCTSQVSPEDFRAMVASAASECGVSVQMLHEAGHAVDHPVPAQFPEGRYLKYIVCRVHAQW